MSFKDFLGIFTTIDRCRVFDASWSVASSWIPYNVDPRSDGRFHIRLNHASETVIALTQPDTRYYGAFNADFINTLSFHIFDKDQQLIKRAKLTVPYSKRSVNCELSLEAGSYTVVPHVTREPTDIVPDQGHEGEVDTAISPATRTSEVQVVVEPVTMDKSSYMFQQRKATLIRSMSMARVTGRKLLGVDDEDYESDNEPEELEEAQWQIMLGLRVYSHDSSITLKGIPGLHPRFTRPQERKAAEAKAAAYNAADPENITTALLQKKRWVAEPEEEREE